MININTSWLITIIYLKTANNPSVAFSGHPVHSVQAIQVAHSPHLIVNIEYNMWLFCQSGNLGYSLPTPFREYTIQYADVLSPHTFFGVYNKICCFFCICGMNLYCAVEASRHDSHVLSWRRCKKTLPKALRTQALTALTSNFGLVGLVQYAW